MTRSSVSYSRLDSGSPGAAMKVSAETACPIRSVCSPTSAVQAAMRKWRIMRVVKTVCKMYCNLCILLVMQFIHRNWPHTVLKAHRRRTATTVSLVENRRKHFLLTRLGVANKTRLQIDMAGMIVVNAYAKLY